MHRSGLPTIAFALLCGLSLAACPAKEEKKGGGEEAHEHKAPHGGEVLELGNEEGHLEMIHDHDGGKVTVYVFSTGFDKPISVAKPTITIQQKDGTSADVPLTAVEPKADGTAHQWKGEHAALKSDPWDGRIRLQIAGKNYQSPLEGAGHDHK
jgi:hypothetical protein